MNIQDSTKNERSIRCLIEENELEEIVLRHIANLKGVPMDNSFKGRAYHVSRDTSTGIRHDMQVEITIDLSMYPTCAEGEPK